MTEPDRLAVTELKRAIAKLRLKCGHGEGSFVPRQGLRDCLTARQSRSLKDLFNDLSIPLGLLKTIRERYLRVFVILVLVNKSGHIGRFLENDRLSDKHLPFDRYCFDNTWPRDCVDFFEQFYDQQWEFCVRRWKADKLTDLRLEKEALLPIVKEVILRDGSNSKTMVVDLCPEYNQLESKPYTDTFVLKTCSLKHRKYYQNELETYQILSEQVGVLPNIVHMYGNFEHQEQLHLVLEHVKGGTLQELYDTIRPELDQIPAFWSRFLAIFTVIFQLHQLKLKYRNEHLKAIHQDIKPSNILLARSDESTFQDTVFKLIDFAFSEYRRQTLNNTAEFWDEGGTQTFSAPEITRLDPVEQSSVIRIDASVDTWAFGAVLSETLVWCALGKAGVEDYRSRRREETKDEKLLAHGGYDECFHNGTRVLNAVEDMHYEALAACEANKEAHGVLFKISTFAEDMLAEEPHARPPDDLLRRRFQNIIRRANNSPQPNGTLDPGHTGAATTLPITVPTIALPSPQRMPAPEQPPSSDLSPVQDGNRSRAHSTSTDDAISPQSASVFSGDQDSYTPSLRAQSNMAPTPEIRLPSNVDSMVQNAPLSNIDILDGQAHEQMRNTYPDLTIKDALEWIDKLKEHSKRPLGRFSSKPRKLDGMSLLERLRGRDQVFLFDDSLCMNSSWLTERGVVKAFRALGYLVKNFSPDKMQACFTSKEPRVESKDRTEILKKIQEPEFSSDCNMSYWLKDTLDHWKADRRLFENQDESSNKRPRLSLYIFTTGVWTEVPGSSIYCHVDVVLRDLIEEMKVRKIPAQTVQIRFIRFGDHAVGIERLERLMKKFHGGDIRPVQLRTVVDCEPCTGNVFKMLLGSYAEDATTTV